MQPLQFMCMYICYIHILRNIVNFHFPAPIYSHNFEFGRKVTAMNHIYLFKAVHSEQRKILTSSYELEKVLPQIFLLSLHIKLQVLEAMTASTASWSKLVWPVSTLLSLSCTISVESSLITAISQFSILSNEVRSSLQWNMIVKIHSPIINTNVLNLHFLKFFGIKFVFVSERRSNMSNVPKKTVS